MVGNKIVKLSVSLVMTFSLVTGSLVWSNPSVGQANTKDELIKQKKAEIAELERQTQEAQSVVKEIEQKINRLRNEENQLHSEIAQLDGKIAQKELEIAQKEEEIAVTEAKAYQAALELEEAEIRVQEREELLKTRVRAMYESGGKVNYMEVLMGSSSFGDFVERLDFLSLLVQQDNKIIEDFIAAKDLVEQKKIEIDGYLVQLENQMNQLNAFREGYRKQQREKQMVVASIQETQEELAAEEEKWASEAMALASQAAQASKELEDLQWDGIFAWPVPDSKRITSNFGLRVDPFTGARRGHNGMDIGAPQGTTIVAAASGVVLVAEYLRGYGNTVIIEHGDGIRTLYAHIRNGGIKVSSGQKVERGDKIAEVGSTGRSTGPHLHFEVHKNGVQTDPLDYLRN